MADLITAAASGDHRQLLEAMRELVAAEIAIGVPARDLASLSKRLLDISQELAELPDPTDESEADRIARELDTGRDSDT